MMNWAWHMVVAIAFLVGALVFELTDVTVLTRGECAELFFLLAGWFGIGAIARFAGIRF